MKAGVPPEARWASFFREERRRVQEIGRETQRPPGSTLYVLMHMAGPLIDARCTSCTYAAASAAACTTTAYRYQGTYAMACVSYSLAIPGHSTQIVRVV